MTAHSLETEKRPWNLMRRLFVPIRSILMVLLLASSAFGPLAGATEQRPTGHWKTFGAWRVYLNEKGLPLCMRLARPLGGTALAFRYQPVDIYGNQVEYAEVDPEGCEKVEERRYFPLDFFAKAKWSTLEADEGTRIEDRMIPLPISRILEQAQLGATTSREELDAKEYLETHPTPYFHRALNRSLTKKYGAAFAASVYKAWVESQPPHQEMRKSTAEYISRAADLDTAALRARFGNAIVLNARYLGAPDSSAGRVQPFLDDLAAAGFETRSFDTHGRDSVEVNSEQIQTELHQILATGRNVLLLGASKGISDALTALAKLEKRYPSPRPESWGKVLALISVNGAVEGSMISDAGWENELPAKIVDAIVRFLGKVIEKLPIKSLESLQDLSSKSQSERFAWVSAKLPKDTVYLNLISVIPGNGIAQDPQMKRVQEAFRGSYKFGYGANDGFIEYPGTAIPQAWAPHVYSLVMDASHMVSDGTFENLALADPVQRQTFFFSALRALADRLP